MPLALEDFDSNYSWSGGVQRRIHMQVRTLVNMLGEEAMVELRAKPQLQ